jgi:hypothetical protein
MIGELRMAPVAGDGGMFVPLLQRPDFIMAGEAGIVSSGRQESGGTGCGKIENHGQESGSHEQARNLAEHEPLLS